MLFAHTVNYIVEKMAADWSENEPVNQTTYKQT
jgi:hypothetical protein